ncbi:uncharacterized protein BDW47DRAFT_119779 [Aspergillus candidus]|uniref:Uncharacterized protein n=1 Tax=Aspergillus candidus TaxID=41067 RepID=A0A2I2F3C3_ASPCN|nr:hypothetical protein BDW47DRAFT_119779 [Aspergillus candidus]PLB35086.1 hypothetical protein BDW47DRAFT_119779 [Aspergillus candidus]
MPINRSRWQWSTRSKATSISRCGRQLNSRRHTEGVQTGVVDIDDDLQSPRNWPNSETGSRWPSAPPSSSLRTKMRHQRQVSSPTDYTWNPIMFIYQRCPIFLALSLYHRQFITGMISDYFGPTGRAIDQSACWRVSFFATSAAAAVLTCGIQPL